MQNPGESPELGSVLRVCEQGVAGSNPAAPIERTRQYRSAESPSNDQVTGRQRLRAWIRNARTPTDVLTWQSKDTGFTPSEETCPIQSYP